MRDSRMLLFCMVLVASVCGSAVAQSIKATASTNRCLLDEVLTIRVEVKNPTQASSPVPPQTTDFDIVLSPGAANPAVSRNQFFINGRGSSSVTYTYVFEACPQRAGKLTIPPFTLKDGGKTYESRPIVIQVAGGNRQRDFFCKVVVPRKTVYIGEPVQLRLEAWIRKYSQRGLGTLTGKIMANIIDLRRSQFGVFQGVAAMIQFDRQDGVRAKAGKVKQTNDYYVYKWTQTVYPTSLGSLDCGDIRLACEYPVQLSRGVFGGLQHQKSARRLLATATSPKLNVKPVPLEGRPADYNGAVGRFTIDTTASPTRVPMGDPITLTLTIHGSVPLQRVGAPELEQVESLTKDFGVSAESLAGELKPGRKEFSLTIRALRENVTEIPPIPMSHFDPDNGRYETAWSQAIPIEVLPVQRLALSAGTETDAATNGELTPLLETTDGLQANHVDADAILADQTGGFGVVAVALLGLMPVVYLAMWFVTRRSAYFRENIALRRRRRAYGQAKRRVARTGGDGRELGGAVLTYVADRCDVPSAGLTRADAVALLVGREVSPETADRFDAFLADQEHARYAGGSAGDGRRMAAEAREILDQLERCDLS